MRTTLEHELERAAGIEPASSAWKAEVIAIIRCPRTLNLISRDLLIREIRWRMAEITLTKLHLKVAICATLSDQWSALLALTPFTTE